MCGVTRDHLVEKQLSRGFPRFRLQYDRELQCAVIYFFSRAFGWVTAVCFPTLVINMAIWNSWLLSIAYVMSQNQAWASWKETEKVSFKTCGKERRADHGNICLCLSVINNKNRFVLVHTVGDDQGKKFLKIPPWLIIVWWLINSLKI